jgi:hypothetical protein
MSKRHYAYRGKLYTAKTLAEMLWKKNRHSRHRKYGYSFVYANVMMDDQKIRLFLTRKSRRSEWRGYLTTNLKLSFEDAFKIYSMRWGIEVVNYDKLLVMTSGQVSKTDYQEDISLTLPFGFT